MEAYSDKSFKSWHTVVGWGKEAEALALGHEGQVVCIKGRLSTRSYEKDGKKVWQTEVVAQDVILLGASETSPSNEEAPF